MTTAVAPARGLAVIKEELQGIAVAHNWPCPKRKNNSLQPRHVEEFELDSVEEDGTEASYFAALFIRFARVICNADCVVRKELFETWAMALHVHDHFPNVLRFADMASGHGLLSWALLLLNENRTAICVDVRMPKSAEKLRDAFCAEWPHLEGRWDFVEGKLEYVEPAPSTLIVGVHCCGPLSDKVVDLAIKGKSPLALVPCCHTNKHLSKEQRQDIMKQSWTLADWIDKHRIDRLEEANFDVVEGTIPKVFTPKNRIILATPPPVLENLTTAVWEETNLEPVNKFLGSKMESKDADSTSLPPPQSIIDNESICRVPFGLPAFAIPIADIHSSHESIRKISGRAAANLRKGHPRTYSLSLFQPPGPIALTPDQVASVANTLDENVCAWGSFVDKEGFLYKDGRLCRTYRLTYRSKGEAVLTKAEAKAIHIQLCHKVEEFYPGAQVRQIPR
mmetsp:Transcript_23669/g.58021  ORF Transcript_23669/g.58021 Transcript_23669/m.58021 type:complete len:450 (+) Transcript_23669:211-1560(+)|eukprot:CAMPEP_0113625668 /NCGR_PEP_ID=MMETSP0017_2-20120614/13262_1 /TAXON_ID=2856 /ORGANISM="Cylindrotheca closterium" /LENGTH=449 /DNA_ID=CAMNT_0000535797 /DNA_START=184 /DNA_END=1533 /DNA_ORIENTATION=+ /assembly_acc=CAM_ASM_000147